MSDFSFQCQSISSSSPDKTYGYYKDAAKAYYKTENALEPEVMALASQLILYEPSKAFFGCQVNEVVVPISLAKEIKEAGKKQTKQPAPQASQQPSVPDEVRFSAEQINESQLSVKRGVTYIFDLGRRNPEHEPCIIQFDPQKENIYVLKGEEEVWGDESITHARKWGTFTKLINYSDGPREMEGKIIQGFSVKFGDAAQGEYTLEIGCGPRNNANSYSRRYSWDVIVK